MFRLRFEYPIRLLCRVLRSSVSGYYSWLKRKTSLPAQHTEHLVALVKAAHHKTRGTYGAARLHEELIADGHSISLWKVKQIRRQHGLVLARKRTFVRTTDSNHTLPIAANLLKRQFVQSACNRVWVSDITYIPTRDGWLYLAGMGQATGAAGRRDDFGRCF